MFTGEAIGFSFGCSYAFWSLLEGGIDVIGEDPEVSCADGRSWRDV